MIKRILRAWEDLRAWYECRGRFCVRCMSTRADRSESLTTALRPLLAGAADLPVDVQAIGRRGASLGVGVGNPGRGDGGGRHPPRVRTKEPNTGTSP